jgi:prevent-host-death family protein
MTKHVPIPQASAELTALIAEVEATGQPIILTRDGKPAVQIGPPAPDPDQARRIAVLAQIAANRDALARAHPETAVPLSWEELKADMEESR